MFTGIVQSQAYVKSLKCENNLARLVLTVPAYLIEALQTGASVAVNGVCLTVVDYGLDKNEAFIAFDVIEETLRVSNLSDLMLGSAVNIERSLKIGDELGGHIVSGHVHCQTPLLVRQATSANCTLTFLLPEQWRDYLLAKGFITINGISLTVGDIIDNNSFTVHLIPETLQRTNLANIAIGDTVNVEFDQQTITIVTTIKRMGLSVN